jgi:26S proteasome regulatory subunit N2
LYEDPKFKQRELAGLVASKVYYHLGEYDESIMFALGAGKLFDITSKSEYVETIICTSRHFLRLHGGFANKS